MGRPFVLLPFSPLVSLCVYVHVYVFVFKVHQFTGSCGAVYSTNRVCVNRIETDAGMSIVGNVHVACYTGSKL